jgi:hypothetical protein
MTLPDASVGVSRPEVTGDAASGGELDPVRINLARCTDNAVEQKKH